MFWTGRKAGISWKWWKLSGRVGIGVTIPVILVTQNFHWINVPGPYFVNVKNQLYGGGWTLRTESVICSWAECYEKGRRQIFCIVGAGPKDGYSSAASLGVFYRLMAETGQRFGSGSSVQWAYPKSICLSKSACIEDSDTHFLLAIICHSWPKTRIRQLCYFKVLVFVRLIKL